jgi:hypothetical protein
MHKDYAQAKQKDLTKEIARALRVQHRACGCVHSSMPTMNRHLTGGHARKRRRTSALVGYDMGRIELPPFNREL